jgi:hypothetical protein|tara:strand:+ start:18 stop:308 length:291 start_codon:yes stop_codon:yes gene_type:complete
MKVYRKIILDKNNKVLYEDSYDYEGTWSYLGIHFDYKSTRGAKAMEKKAKREKKLAERRAKRQAKFGDKKEEENTSKIKVDEPLSLDFITNPDKGK